MSVFHHFMQAQSQTDFAVEIFDKDWIEKDWPSIISKQTRKLEINFHERTVTLYLRQLKAGIIQDILFHVLGAGDGKIDKVTITPARGNTSSHQYHFVDGRVSDHQCVFSLEETGDLIHKLSITFDRVVLAGPKGDQRREIVLGEPKQKSLLMEEVNEGIRKPFKTEGSFLDLPGG